MMNQYYNPVRTIQEQAAFGFCRISWRKWIRKIRRSFFLEWDGNAVPAALISRLKEEKAFDVRTTVFEASNPTVEQLFETYEETRKFSPDVVVAVGGGSIMDVGKSLCCLYGKEIPDEEALRSVIENRDYGKISARWIGVPTTAGTGSETTCWATIWDPSMDVKRSVENRENYAYAALVDPQLAAGMPLKLAVSSALDAAAHAVKATGQKGRTVYRGRWPFRR